jgi:serine/threonine protein kinase
MPSANLHAEGSIIAGRYAIVRLLGRGGMGAVYEARNTVTGRAVALKIPRDDLARDEAFRGRFLREARAASALSHPNVIDVLDIAVDADETPVLVMELLQGAALSDLLAQQGKLPLGEAAACLVPIFDALAAAHDKGIIHRDLKPENIFIAEQVGGQRVPKLLDFGIAKLSEGSAVGASASATATGAMLGTPYYMAPEQVSGRRDLDQRADVWAAGAVAYECLSGRRPFSGDNFGQIFVGILQTEPTRLAELVPDLPPEIDACVHHALSRDRDARASTVHELRDALAAHATPLYPGALSASYRPPPGARTPIVITSPASAISGAGAATEGMAATVAAPSDPPAPPDPRTDPTLAVLEPKLPVLAKSTGTLSGSSTEAPTLPRRKRRTALAAAAALLAISAAVFFAAGFRLSSNEMPAPSPAALPSTPLLTVTASAPPPASAPAPAPSASLGAPSVERAPPPASAPAPLPSARPGGSSPLAKRPPLASAAPAPAAVTAPPTGPGGLIRDPSY